MLKAWLVKRYKVRIPNLKSTIRQPPVKTQLKLISVITYRLVSNNLIQDPLRPKVGCLDVPFKNFVVLAHFHSTAEKLSLRMKRIMISRRRKYQLNPHPHNLDSWISTIAACAIMINMRDIIRIIKLRRKRRARPLETGLVILMIILKTS